MADIEEAFIDKIFGDVNASPELQSIIVDLMDDAEVRQNPNVFDHDENSKLTKKIKRYLQVSKKLQSRSKWITHASEIILNVLHITKTLEKSLLPATTLLYAKIMEKEGYHTKLSYFKDDNLSSCLQKAVNDLLYLKYITINNDVLILTKKGSRIIENLIDDRIKECPRFIALSRFASRSCKKAIEKYSNELQEISLALTEEFMDYLECDEKNRPQDEKTIKRLEKILYEITGQRSSSHTVRIEKARESLLLWRAM